MTCAFFAMQAVRSWRSTLTAAAPAILLAEHGTRELLFIGADLCGKLAGVAYAQNAKLQREAALLGATFCGAVFAGSIVHPQRAVDFAAYTPVAVTEASGSIFEEPHALCLHDVASGVEALADALVDGTDSAPVEALPVLALWEWLSVHIRRDSAMTVRARVSRANALINLGLLGSAYDTITGLMVGAKLPSMLGHGSLVHQLPDGAGPYSPPEIPTFHTALYPGAAENRAAVDFVSHGGMHAAVAECLKPHAAAQVAMLRCRLLHALGTVPCVWTQRSVVGAPLGAVQTLPEKVRFRARV